MTSTTTTAQRSDTPEETIAAHFLKAGLNLFGEDGSVRTSSYAKALAKYAASNVVEIADYQDGSSREVLAAEPEYLPSLNDAEIRGTEPEGFSEFLGREATLLVGEMWGARDRRNTQDSAWQSPSMSWHQWIEGGADNGNAPAWGFSRHPAGKNKAGPCIVLGSSVGGARKAKAMDTMYAMGLDIDSGAKLDDVLADIEEKGLLCLVYTSYNNGTSGLELKRDEVLRKLKITRDPTEAEIKQYLREFDKNRYEESFIAGCSISAQKKQTTEGVKIILDTPPLEKFRLIFPLETPVKLIDLADTQQASLDMWEDKITGLAQNTLGIHFDTSCTDPSRLFYTARHPKGSDNWYAAVVMGTPLRFDDVTPMKKSTYTSNREVNAFTIAGVEAEGDRQPQCHTPSGASLNEWHRTAKDRFMIADLLETLCPDKIRIAGGEAQGHVHTECPFENEHSSEGGTATMAVNAVDSQSEYWTWFCHHDSCQGRHKLQYLEEALRQGWFEEDALFDIDLGFMLPAADGEIDPFETEDAKREREANFEKWAGDFDPETANASDVELFVSEAFASGIDDAAVRERISSTLSKSTVLSLPALRAMWTKCERDARADALQQREEQRRNAPRPRFVPLEDATAETIENAAKDAAWLPSFVTYRDGWFYAPDFDKPDGGAKRLCRAFEVPFVGFGETEEGRTNEITIRYRHRSKQRGIVESVYSIGEAFRDSGSLISRLADDGLEIDAMAKVPSMVALLKAVQTDNEAVLVQKPGWIGDAYVSPTGRVANAGSVQYILDPEARVSGKTQGTLEEHHMYATTALTGVNGKYFLPGYLSGLVGMVVDYIENDVSILLAHEGDGGRGKTSAGKAGAAHHAPADSTGLFSKADATPAYVERKAEQANGAVCVLDEDGASKLDAHEKQRVYMQWTEGMGRGRATADGGTRRTRSWRTCFVTSAEREMLRVFEAAGVDTKTGTIARTFSVNFSSAAELDPASDELAAIKALSGDDKERAVYGVTAPVFAVALAKLGRETVRERVSAVMADWADLAPGSSARRVVRVAAIFAVTGEIAQEAGLFGDAVQVRQHMRELLEDNMDARMGHLDTDRQQVEAVRRAVRRGVQMGTIVPIHNEEGYNRQETLGFHGHFDENGRTDEAAMNKIQDQDAEMQARTYLIPINRMGKLGITTDPRALALRLRDAGGLVERKKGDRMQWFHDYMPGEGSEKHIRVSGEFIHG
ncbi:DUF927 domain-containing protein [Sulfitobacter pontiacus]|jgi:hypothetical protein|uniref:DUF927 domain-containing protein n=1 Tax=Sulfitobacter pontiacus TaxID=60137 RepID=UPI000E8F70B7|nr:DUF927 domain-containing protein [Sulfitobacter pontiacus]HBU53223.1 hypothetical protein [Sulfitobacter sp.]|tara:strand:- start:2059 stop:5715 length:3657 start_codon:yes stop_codon:yes gene_type:complete